MSLSNAAAAGHCPFAALAALAFREEEGGGADRPDHRERCPGRSTMRMSIGFAAALLLWASATGLAQNAPRAEAALHRTEYPEGDLSIVDILPAGCSKGRALLNLARDRGVEREEILAIGDNWNDVSMTRRLESSTALTTNPGAAGVPNRISKTSTSFEKSIRARLSRSIL